MKKIVSVMILICMVVSLSACTAKPTYSLSPKEDISKFTQEIKDDLQRKLEELPSAPSGVSFSGYDAKYDDEGGFIIYGFLRNKTGRTIYNIKGEITASTDYLTIASGNFEFTEEAFGKLENGDSRPWTLTFTQEYVVNIIAKKDLYKYSIEGEYTYEQERRQ